ncbi:MAG: chromosomal replication initiator protein DnaA [Planctomycetota bacterium]|jgi:chromosomal replication initiator protein
MDESIIESGSLTARTERPDRPSPRVARAAAPRQDGRASLDRGGQDRSPQDPGLFDPRPAAAPGAAGGIGTVAEGEEVEYLAASLRDALVASLAPEQFQTWFKRSKLIRVDDDSAVIAVPNSFAREWIAKYYLDVLQRAVDSILGTNREVVLVEQPESLVAEPAPEVVSELAHGQPPRHDRSPAEGAGSGAAQEAPGRREQQPVRRSQLDEASDFVLNPKCTFESFVVGPCNRFGHAAALGAAEQPGKSYNPLFLHGRVGVGKTHLLQAFCYSVLERFPDSRILYLSCETFVNHFIDALENGDMMTFRDKYRNIDVLVVDDIQLLANKERTQEEFFHTFNSLYNAGKQIVLSSDSPPKDIPTLQDRLVSRFKWGMVTEIEPPCFETRMAIVKRKARERGTELPDEVAQFISENIEENVRELEGAVTRLFGYTRLTNAKISVDLAREALAGLIDVRAGAPTVDDIISLVTEHYQVKLSELQSKKRTKAIAFPRQVAMYLSRKVTRHSLEEIGGFFGGRDHTTVLYAVEKIEKEIAADREFSRRIQHFLDRLGSGGRR